MEKTRITVKALKKVGSKRGKKKRKRRNLIKRELTEKAKLHDKERRQKSGKEK